MAEWRKLTSDGPSSLLFSFAVEVDPEHLSAALERTATANGVNTVDLVLTDKRNRTELARTPVEGACNWQHLSARFDTSKRQLDITIRLLPHSAADPLVQEAATAPAKQPAAPQTAAKQVVPAPAAEAVLSDKPKAAEAAAAVAAGPTEHQATCQAAQGNSGIPASDSADISMPLAAADMTQAATAEASSGIAAAPIVESGMPQPAADGVGAAASEDDSPAIELPAEAAVVSAASEASKKKKKKKKKKKGQAAAGSGDEAGEGEDEAAPQAGVAAGSEQADDLAKHAPAQAEVASAAPAGVGLEQQVGEGLRQGDEPAAVAADGSAGLAAAEAPSIPGVTELGKEVEHSLLGGLFVREALSKDRKKDAGGGEDQWLIKPANAWGLDGAAERTSFSAFGVFDGHGGRQVATFASNSLLKAVMAEVDSSPVPLQEVPEVEGLSEAEAAQWRLQATLMKRLPQACSAAFQAVDADAQRRWPQRGGTTATLAVACGWELLVANVGDTCAYLDTGSEVLQLSGNHRLEANKDEVARCEAAGHDVAPSVVDGKPAGPIRVWPGGLNMARTIGDAEAGAVVIAEPEICQVTLPARGARLLIGSDGLWDALQPKTAAHHCRDMTAAEAAHRLLALAIKKDRLKDDVTVVVVDFLPDASARLPPALVTAQRGSGSEQPAHLAHVWHPARESWDWLAAGAERRQQLLAEQRLLEAEAAAEAQRLLERQQEELEAKKRDSFKRAAESGVTADNLEALEGMSDLHRELATLRLSPEDIAEGLRRVEREEEQKRRQEMEGEWETVGTDKAEAAEAPDGAGGRGRLSGRSGRGRSGRGDAQHGGRGGRGRGRGRGRGELAADAPAEHGVHEEGPAAAPAAPPDQPAVAEGAAARPVGDAAPGSDQAEASPATASLYFRPPPAARPAASSSAAAAASAASAVDRAAATSPGASGGRGRGGRVGGRGSPVGSTGRAPFYGGRGGRGRTGPAAQQQMHQEGGSASSGPPVSEARPALKPVAAGMESMSGAERRAAGAAAPANGVHRGRGRGGMSGRGRSGSAAPRPLSAAVPAGTA
ncbi:hypothetical protein ABPG77_007691 [Micractinium sp. CCAP 211/92]